MPSQTAEPLSLAATKVAVSYQQRNGIPLYGAFDQDDLIQEAILGVLVNVKKHALDGYQISSPQSSCVMEYAIKNFLRQQDPLSKHYRAAYKRLLAVKAEYEAEHGKLPSTDELCNKLQITRTSYRNLMRTIGNSDPQNPKSVEPVHDLNTEEIVVLRDLIERAMQLVETLSQKKQRIVKAFLRGESYKDIATRESCSVPRVSVVVREFQQRAQKVLLSG